MNYDWASGVQVEKFLANSQSQEEILNRTIEQQSNQENFVTDRTTIDLAAYTIAELQGNTEKIEKIVTKCKEMVHNYTHLILCPWKAVPLESNGVRTIDPYYQFIIHSLIFSLIKEWNLNAIILTEENKDDIIKDIGKN
jgi:hypothetical protein